jgi:type II secretory pathway pseudopilin PulG
VSRHTHSMGGQTGFAVVQTLIVAAIAALVVAIGIPVYAARAKDSVLRQNAATLELELKSYLAVGLDATYVGDDEPGARAGADDERSASEVFAEALSGHGDGTSAYYVNPLNGSRAIVCQTTLPATAGGTPPAVWITDDERYAFAAFTASPTTKSRLRGTLMIVFIGVGGRTSGIEVFYVDAAGKKSATATTLGI